MKDVAKPQTALDASSDISFQAFGQDISLAVNTSNADVDRRLGELNDIYTPALASRVLPKTGFCLDLGAGEGWFGLPFATAFPSWQVVCMEPDDSAFALLERNVAALGLTNVTCIQAALCPENAENPVDAKLPTGATLSGVELAATLKPEATACFTPLSAIPPRLALAPEGTAPAELVTCPSLPVSVLKQLSPDLIKLDAPYCEEAIAQALHDIPVGLVMGPLYAYVPSQLFSPSPDAGPRELYLPHRNHVLTRAYEDNFASRKPGLDVVVAMYNCANFILECVDSLLSHGDAHIRVLVVDDGSTDGSGDIVRGAYIDEPRVVHLHKENGGCASARNYGRMHSKATHIAFVDADDRVDPEMYSALFETASYTGANVVEAGFRTFEVSADGETIFTDSYETEADASRGKEKLGPYGFTRSSGLKVAPGQPTIWRRIHRRDFLDRNDIWFPEHVRAFDDQLFQLLIAQYSGDIARVSGFYYHYRQHAAQDIRQGDERHFYSFNMYRNLFIRALNEGWQDIEPFYTALFNTMAWSYPLLRSDLQHIYQEAAAEFLATLSLTFDYKFRTEDLIRTNIDGLPHLVAHALGRKKDLPSNYGYIRLESWRWQPEFIRMRQKL